jgi:hypothetical protein
VETLVLLGVEFPECERGGGALSVRRLHVGVSLRTDPVIDTDVEKSLDDSTGHAQDAAELNDGKTFRAADRHPTMRASS